MLVTAAVGGLLVAGALVPSSAESASALGPLPTSSSLGNASDSAALHAISGADFDPGYIISDELFYDGAAMTQSEIQAFLDAKIGACQNGRCLNVIRVSSISRGADSYCSG
jgi:hypothetical protein